MGHHGQPFFIADTIFFFEYWRCETNQNLFAADKYDDCYGNMLGDRNRRFN